MWEREDAQVLQMVQLHRRRVDADRRRMECFVKTIRINRLVLEHFKCHSYLVLEPMGSSVSIFGENASGKTSVYDAVLWLLFGRDSLGNSEKSVAVKPLGADGKTADSKAITAVEAELCCNGQIVTLRKEMREIWVIRRGSMSLSFDGNQCTYLVNGVPMQKNAYDAVVTELVQEQLFQMLTKVDCFADGLSWQKRRAILFEMTGSPTDLQLMRRDSRFAELETLLGNDSVDVCRERLTNRKKKLRVLREDLPVRISESERMMQALGDAEGLNPEKEIECVQQQIQQLERDSLEAQQKVQTLEQQLVQLEWENEQFRHGQETGAVEIHRLRQKQSDNDALISRQKTLLEHLRKLEQDTGPELEGWEKKTFSDNRCPACGQTIPEALALQKKLAFEREKEKQLCTIRQRLQRLETEISQADKTLSEVQAEAAADGQLIQRLLEEKESQRIVDCPDYARRKEELTNLLQKAKQDCLREDPQKKCMLQETLAGLQRRQARWELRSQTIRRMNELRQEEAAAAGELEAVERGLRMLESFERFKAGFLEQQVCFPFRLAQFRLFREQVNGGLEQRCDVTVDGVPYGSLNHAMKINVGIDIINALSRHYGVLVPLFVDNAEAVTRLEHSDSQCIRLVVSPGDYALRMEKDERRE